MSVLPRRRLLSLCGVGVLGGCAGFSDGGDGAESATDSPKQPPVPNDAERALSPFSLTLGGLPLTSIELVKLESWPDIGVPPEQGNLDPGKVSRYGTLHYGRGLDGGHWCTVLVGSFDADEPLARDEPLPGAYAEPGRYVQATAPVTEPWEPAIETIVERIENGSESPLLGSPLSGPIRAVVDRKYVKVSPKEGVFPTDDSGQGDAATPTGGDESGIAAISMGHDDPTGSGMAFSAGVLFERQSAVSQEIAREALQSALEKRIVDLDTRTSGRLLIGSGALEPDTTSTGERTRTAS